MTVTPGLCWAWLGARDRDGYAVGPSGRRGRSAQMHRLVYEALERPVPEGLELDHVCGIRHCVNPDHLEPVTHRVNTLRGEGPTARNARKTHCAQGHPYDEANTYYWRGKRNCRACQNDASRRYKARRTQAREGGQR